MYSTGIPIGERLQYRFVGAASGWGPGRGMLILAASVLFVAVLNVSCGSRPETGPGNPPSNPPTAAPQQPSTPSAVARLFMQDLMSKNVSKARERMSLAARETMQTNLGPVATGQALPALAEMLSQCSSSQMEVSPASGADIRPDIGAPLLITFAPKCGDRRAAIFALFPTWCCPPEPGPLTSCLVRTQLVNDQLRVTSVGCS